MTEKVTMKPGTMLNPLPVVLATVSDGKEDNVITIAWTGIVNTNPPMTYISVRKSRHSHALLQKSKEFVINLTNQDMVKETDFCGVRSGRDMDKFQVCGFTKVPADLVSAPLIAEAPVNLECKVVEVHEYPSHDMFVAEIVSVHAQKNLFDETGRLCLDEANLISYSHGEYFALSQRPLGKFGYSVMKQKTARRYQKEMNERNRRKSSRNGFSRRKSSSQTGGKKSSRRK